MLQTLAISHARVVKGPLVSFKLEELSPLSLRVLALKVVPFHFLHSWDDCPNSPFDVEYLEHMFLNKTNGYLIIVWKGTFFLDKPSKEASC